MVGCHVLISRVLQEGRRGGGDSWSSLKTKSLALRFLAVVSRAWWVLLFCLSLVAVEMMWRGREEEGRLAVRVRVSDSVSDHDGVFMSHPGCVTVVTDFVRIAPHSKEGRWLPVMHPARNLIRLQEELYVSKLSILPL